MEWDPVTLDNVDQRLLHALHLDARASFARIGDVIGVSDRTVGRRYARLRDRKVINLVGVLDPSRLDGADPGRQTRRPPTSNNRQRDVHDKPSHGRSAGTTTSGE